MLRPLALATVVFCTFGCGGEAEDGVAPDGASLGDTDASALEALAATATQLSFRAGTTVVSNPPPELKLTVNDPKVVRALFLETISQPPLPAGATSCPTDFGIVYHMVFVASDGTATTADAKPSGCQTITIDGSLVLTVASNPTYWRDLADGLQIGESAIYPYTPQVY
jgi:hypothetical protein